jgi:uncharacterized Zn finger protein
LKLTQVVSSYQNSAFGRKSTTPMNLQNFNQQIDPSILKRGKAYSDDGLVVSIEEEEDGLWRAEVEGSEVYAVEVEISGDGGIERYSCDCPHDADICKHIVAVFYELKDLVEPVKIKAVKSQSVSFAELLKRVSVSELRTFVELVAKNDKQFKNRFELHFAHKDEQGDVEKKYMELVKKLIRSCMSHGYVDYYSARDLSNKIDGVLAKAQEAMDARNFKNAVLICGVVLKQLIVDVIPSADDSNGDIGDSISTATSLLQQIAEDESCPKDVKERLHDFLGKELKNDTYFDYGDFGDHLFETFRHLSVQLNRSETFLSFAQKLPATRSDSWIVDYRTEYFIRQTILFFQETGNTIEAGKLIRQHIDIVEVRQALVEEEIGKKDYMEAKRLVYEGITVAERRKHPGTVSAWQKILLRIAVLEGDVVTERHFNLQFAFDSGFSPEYYQAWMNTFPEAERDTELRRLVQKITDEVEQEAEKHLNNQWWSKSNTLLRRLAPIYVQEKLWDKLYEVVEAYPSLEVLLAYMKYLAKDYQTQVIDLLSPALVLAGDRADSRSGYAQIASNMKDIMKLMPASKGKILEAAQILRVKYPRRPAMLDELKVIR